MKVSVSDKTADIILALAVAIVFSLFAATVMELDAFVKAHPPIPPGRTVYM